MFYIPKYFFIFALEFKASLKTHLQNDKENNLKHK